jgi:hypothetical protein
MLIPVGDRDRQALILVERQNGETRERPVPRPTGKGISFGPLLGRFALPAMADDRQGSPQDGQAPKAGGNRLPPPAFPPGQRIQPRANHRPAAPSPDEPAGEVPDDAFISPDEPITRTGSRIADGAFIPPDAPLPRRGIVSRAEEGVVTGMDDDAHLGREELARSQGGDPIVADLALRVGRLADGLRAKGEAALKTTSDMSKFETTLRAYCVGYLAAQRDSGSGD